MTDLVTKSSIQESTTSTGPGTLDLDGSATGWNRFRTFFADNDDLVYARRSANGAKQQLIGGQLKYGTGAGGRDQLTVATVLASTDGAGTPTAIDWVAGDNPCAVFCCPAEDLLDWAISRYGALPAWLKRGLRVDPGAGATARKLYWHVNGTDTELAQIDETNSKVVESASGGVVPKSYVDAAVSLGGGRLTLTTAVPVTTADVSGAGTIYLTPYIHNLTKVWDGSIDVLYMRNEISLALDSNAAHTGYHQSSKGFDVFEYVRSGAVVLGTSPAWTNDTTRGFNLTRRNGRLVNAASITLRFGVNSGDTESVAAEKANYVGSFYTTANGQTSDTFTKRLVWNLYNRRSRTLTATDPTNQWTYTTATFRQANNSSANQVEVFRGLDEDSLHIQAIASWSNSNIAVATATAIGLDSTTAAVAGCLMSFTTAPTASQAQYNSARFAGAVGLGWHRLTWLEWSEATGTTTWCGDNNNPLRIQSGISGETFA